MAKYWIDPPEGYLYGFPKMYDELKDGPDIENWLVANGYPEAYKDLAVRSWHVKDEDTFQD